MELKFKIKNVASQFLKFCVLTEMFSCENQVAYLNNSGCLPSGKVGKYQSEYSGGLPGLVVLSGLIVIMYNRANKVN